MAVSMNGSVRSQAKTNGHIKTEPGSRPYKSPSPGARQGFVAWTIAQLVRIAVWYSIATIILRCPKDIAELNDQTPKLCKPYLQVHNFATPYVQPYYTAHVEPHLQKVQPYIGHAQRNFLQPASSFAQANYEKYGAPQVTKAQKFGQKQWDATVLPQLEVARKQAYKQYESTLGPYVQKVDGVVRPYYTGLSTSASDFWELEVQPAYKFASPYIQKGYKEGERFVLHVAVPYTQWINGLVWTGLDRHVFPTARILYGENVEPQIVRIKQRLGRYRDEKKIEAVVSSVASSASSASASSSSVAKSAASSSATIASVSSSSTVASSSAAPSAESSAPLEEEKSASSQFAADLDLWEEQVSKAVSEGAEHLKDRVDDIVKEQTNSQLKKVGGSLLIRLEESSKSGTKDVQKAIQSSVATLPEEVTEEDVQTALKDVETSIRAAGKQVRGSAQQIRAWRKTFDTELVMLIEAAANSTLETIDNIRELRLQDIGRKWASQDGITHSDWTRYNQLKKTSDKWRESITDVLNNHKELRAARVAGEHIEEHAMAVAEDAAKDLGSLKTAAVWKLRAKDASDDFKPPAVPPIVAKVKEQVVNAVSAASEAVVGSSQGTVESLTSAAKSQASDVVDSVSGAIVQPADAAISSASSVSEDIIQSSVISAASVASSMSAEYFGGRESAAEGLASEASDLYASASQQVPSGDASVIKETASSLSSAASDMLARASDELKSMAGEASKSAEPEASAASASIASAQTEASSSSLLSEMGTAASTFSSSVASIEPLSTASEVAADISSSIVSASPISAASEVVDDASSALSSASPLSDASEYVEAASSSVSSAASEAASAVGDAIPEAENIKSTASKASSRVFSGVMAQAVPEQQPVFDEPLDEDEDDDESGAGFAAFLDSIGDTAAGVIDEAHHISEAASEALLGKTETDASGTATSVASELWSSAYAAASSLFYGPQPTDGGVKQFFLTKYDDAVIAASSVVAAFTPTPTPTGYEMAAKVQSQIDAFADSAFDKWQSNIARIQSVQAAAASRISEQISGTPKPIQEQMLKSVEDSYWDAIHAARSKYDNMMSQTKKFEQATQLPYESISSVASENLAKALAQVSNKYSEATSAIGLEPTPAYQSAANEAQRQYYEGLGYAHDQYSSYMRYATRALQSAGLPFVTPTPTPYYEMLLSTAQVKYNEASVSAASALSQILASASSVVGATTTPPAQSVLDAASSQYDAALSQAKKLLYSRQTPAYISWMQKVTSRHSDIHASASEAFQSAYTSALSAAGYQTTDNPSFASATSAAWESYNKVMENAQSAVESVSSYAQTAIYGTQTNDMASASSKFSEMVYGTQTGWTDSIQTQAAENWEAIVSAASEKVYGQPSPIYASVTSQVSSAAAQATSAVADQYAAVSALFASLVSGQEPDYTDKIFAQLSSAYYTGAGNVASSVASLADQATSAVASVFTTPPVIEEYMADVQRNLDAAVSAASASIYGTPTGSVESATSVAASVAGQVSDAAAAAGQEGLVSAQDALAAAVDAAAAANSKISAALFGPATTTPFTDSVASQVSGAAAQVSEALFGKEKEDVRTSASRRLEDMVEAARRQIEGYGAAAQGGAAAVSDSVQSGAEAVRESVASVVDRVKDEL